MNDEGEVFEPFEALLNSGAIKRELDSSVLLFGLSESRPFGERQGEFVIELLDMFPQLTQQTIANQVGAPSAASISGWKTGRVALSASSTALLVHSVLRAAYRCAVIASAGNRERAYIEAGEKFNDVYLLVCEHLRPQTEDAQREHERKIIMHLIDGYLNAMDDKSLAHMLDEARRAYVYEQAMKKDPRIAVPPK